VSASNVARPGILPASARQREVVRVVGHVVEAAVDVGVAVVVVLATTVASLVTCRGTARRKERRDPLDQVVAAEGRATSVARGDICHVTALTGAIVRRRGDQTTASVTTVVRRDICRATAPRHRTEEGAAAAVVNATHVEARITSSATAPRRRAVDSQRTLTYAATTATNSATSPGTVPWSWHSLQRQGCDVSHGLTARSCVTWAAVDMPAGTSRSSVTLHN